MTTPTVETTEFLSQDIRPQCEYVTVHISRHDFQPVGRDDNFCPTPAEFVGMYHLATNHLRAPVFLCGEHMREHAANVCPNPVCQAPRLLDIRPL